MCVSTEGSVSMQGVEMFSLAEKVAVVMGGGGALGGAIAEGFGAVGAQVAIGRRAGQQKDTGSTYSTKPP